MDDGEDFRWVTYAELAAARAVDKATAIRLVQRHKRDWRRRKNNEGTMTIAVPLKFLSDDQSLDPSNGPSSDRSPATIDASNDGSHDDTGRSIDRSLALSGVVEAQKAHIATLGQALDRAVDDMRAERVAAQAREMRLTTENIALKAENAELIRLARRGWWARLRGRG